MREAGFEPTTSASGGQRSIQLSYSRRSTAEKRKAKDPRARSLSCLVLRTGKVPANPLVDKDLAATLSCQLDSETRAREAVDFTHCRLASYGPNHPSPHR
jgi:hypothetical protein